MKKPKSLTAQYALLQSFYWMSSCCVMCFASVFLLSRGFSNTQVGITLAVGNALSILCQPFVAAFADKSKTVPLKTLIALGMGITALASLALLLTPAILLPIGLLYIVLLGVQNIQQVLLTSLGMEHISTGTPLNFSLARGIGSFCFALVSLTLGFLIDRYNEGVIVQANLLFTVMNIFFVLAFTVPQRKKGANQGTALQPAGFFEFCQKNRRFMLTVLSLVFVMFAHVLFNTFTIQVVRNVGGSNADMGVLSAIGGLIELPAMAVFPWVLKKLKSAGLILKLASFFFILKIIAIILAPSVGWLYFAQCLQFFAFAMYLPASIYYVNRTVPSADRVKGQGYIGFTMSISGMLGNVFGGMLIDAVGIRPTLVAGLGLSILGFVALLLVAPNDKPEEEPLQGDFP